ncbi:MAG: hypothetical protein ABIO81_00115 [Ginsengibacter sp.]
MEVCLTITNAGSWRILSGTGHYAQLLPLLVIDVLPLLNLFCSVGGGSVINGRDNLKSYSYTINK